MGTPIAIILAVAICGIAIWLAVSGRARNLDDRVYDSHAGWLMPGGIFYKLGQRDTGSAERWWPYLLGVMDGWMYNAGRERSQPLAWDRLVGLARAYWQERPGEPDSSYGPASGLVHDMIRRGHRDCVSLLSALAATAADEEAVGFVGASAVEDLMSHCGHGEQFIAKLEARAAADERLAAAIKSVWIGDSVADDVRRRLVALGATDLRVNR